MKRFMLSTLFFLTLVSVAHAANDIKIINPWIPETPPGARVMAGFMEIHNSGKQTIDIVEVSSPGFKSVEMHLSKDVNGVAKMLPQEKLSIPAGNTLILKAGSYHLMLITPLKPLLDGEEVVITFTLSNGEKFNTFVPVRKNKKIKHKIMKCGQGKCGGG